MGILGLRVRCEVGLACTGVQRGRKWRWWLVGEGRRIGGIVRDGTEGTL